jgi:oligoribonuclease NrnB/cAMP/cGMP phosphodiesterase (DHH superfamily)
MPGDMPSASFKWEAYDAIYIVDLSVDELMSRPELRSKIVWIDHHKSAIEKWDKAGADHRFIGMRIDGVAACRLCWQWFTFERGPHGDPRLYPWDSYVPSKEDFVERRVVEPELVRLAGEYDIWDHRDPNGKALQFGLRTLDSASFHSACEEQFKGSSVADSLLTSYIQVGHAIKTHMDKQSEEYSAAYSQTIKWEGLTFCALNIGQRGNSDLLRGGIKLEHDACFAWRYDGKNVLVSLYHIDGKTHHDLSLIAVKHGGGGHRGACGFRITLEELSRILNREHSIRSLFSEQGRQ